MQTMGQLFKVMDPKEAAAIATALTPNLQFHNLEGTLVAANPMTGEVKTLASVPKKMKIGDIKGGDDTHEELIKLTGGNMEGFLQAMNSDDPAQQGQAQQIYAQAVQNAQQSKLQKEQRAESRASQREGALGAAIKAGMVQSSRNLADIMSKPMERERETEIRGALAVEDNIKKLANEFTPEERAKYVGMGGLKMNYQKALQLVQQGKADPKFARFSALVNESKAEGFKLGGKSFTATEQGIIFGYIPTGEEWSSEQYEQKLKLAEERIGTGINRQVDMMTTPPGDIKGYVQEQRSKRPTPQQTPGGVRYKVVE
jgi:hypothetical protein